MNSSNAYQDSLNNYHLRIKQRNEETLMSEEKVIFQMLQTKLQLPDGTDTYIFSYGPENEDGNRPFTCHLCWVRSMYGVQEIREHLTGEQHGRNLKRLPIATHFKLPITLSYKGSTSDANKYFKIYAGENISSPDQELKHCFSNQVLWFLRGVDEDVVKRLSVDPINEKNKKNTIMGLSFLGKMETPNANPRYYCFLCEQDVKPEMNDGHMESLKHDMNYIKQHFPYSYKQAEQLLNFLGACEKGEAICGLFRKIYRDIENKNGFKTISVICEADFLASYIRLSSKIWSQDHCSETCSEFAEFRVAAYIGQLIKNPRSYKTLKPLPNSAVDISLIKRKRTAAQMSETMTPTIKRLQLEIVDTTNKNSFLDTCREQELARIKNEYDMYENNPQSYENYSKEWHEFWHSRRAELRRAGINVETYNFQKDWKVFWKKRCERLLNKAIQAKLSEFNESLGPPESSSNTTTTTESMLLSTPPPPCWMDGQQQNEPCQLDTHNKIDTNAILKLLLALENLMGSLGPTAVQLLNQAMLCQQNNKTASNAAMLKELKASFASICKNLENHLAARLMENANVRSLKFAVNDLSKIVNQLAPDSMEHGDAGNLLQSQYNNDKGDVNSATQVDESRQVFDFEVKTYGERDHNSFDSGERSAQQNVGNNTSQNNFNSRQNFSPSSGNNLASNNMQRRSNIDSNHFFLDRDGNFRGQRMEDILENRIAQSQFSPWSTERHFDSSLNFRDLRENFPISRNRGNFSGFR